MDTLVIGGTRYMGRILVQRLLDRGDRVAVLSRGNARPDWWRQVEHVACDRDDGDAFRSSLRDRRFDAVIDMQAFRKEHVESAALTFRGNVGRYLFVSCGSVYLDGKVDFVTHCPFTESVVEWSALEYDYPEGEDPYGVGKRHCEKWLADSSDLPFTIIRIPAVMGWDDPTARMWWWVQRALDGGGVVVPDDHRAPFRSLCSGDAANAFMAALQKEETLGGTYHIASSEVFSNERWAGMIAGAAGTRCDVTYVPSDVIRRWDGLGSYTSPLTRAAPYVHDLSRARRDFSLETTPASDWIATTVAWYRTEYAGDDSAGYEYRSQELALADRWRAAYGELTATFA